MEVVETCVAALDEFVGASSLIGSFFDLRIAMLGKFQGRNPFKKN